jgi:TolB protein
MPQAVGTRVAVAAAMATTLLFPDGVDAAFPGRDGLIAFTRAEGSKPGQIYLVRPDGHGLRQLTHRRRGAGAAAWSPDGRRIAFGAAGQGGLHVYIKRLGGGVRRLTHGDDLFTRPAWSPDGRLIAAIRGHWVGNEQLHYRDSVVVMRANGRRMRTVYAGNQLSTSSPAWSPDGRSIAFVHTDIGAAGADPNIYVVPAEGGAARLITDVGSQTDPDWSPDGRLIAYSWGRELGFDGVRVVRPDGTGDGLLVDDPPVSEGWPAWAPSGRRLAFSRLGRIWTVAADGTRLRRLTDARAGVSDWDPSWQPR